MAAENNLDLSALNDLPEKEREYALQVLKELSEKNGQSKLYNDLRYADYKEIPVDIITFIKDDQYLGRAWHLADGKCKLFPYWEKKLQELFPDNLTTDYNTFIESGARGLGKAQPLNSLVFTEHGYRQMKDIHVGDRVYGNDGKLHNVVGVFPQGIKPVCKITFSDKTTTLCSDEHLWTVYDNAHVSTQKTPKTITCKEMYETGVKLKSGDSRYRIPITRPLEFTHQETLISPYLMGVLLGDGGFSEHSVGFTTYDKEIYDAVAEEIKQKKYSLHPSSNAADNSSWYFVNDYHVKGARTPNIYVEYGKTLGLAGKHAWEKFIPDVYLYNDAESRLALLQGLMDTDGEVDSSYQEAYSTTSETVAKQVVFLVQSLGGTAILRKYTNCSYVYKGERKPCRDSYNINIKMPHDLLPCRLPRKLERLNPRRLNPFRYIKNIEYVEHQECQCILLDSKEHLYLTNDLIVTHNSEIAVAISLYLMHRLMCLKNPHLTLNLKPTEQVAFAFMNITQELALDIGMVKFQNTVQCSPWFRERGTLTGKKNIVWNPPPFIKIIIGSQSSDVIGQAIYFCLDGDTIIATDNGEKSLKELVGKKIRVPTVNSVGEIELSEPCTVLPTATVNDYIEIELEDNTIIKCTPNHRFMLTDGTYKEAQDLTLEDEILESYPFGYIYKFTDLTTNKIYIGKRETPYFDNSYWGSGKRWSEVVKTVGKQQIKREVLCYATTRKELRDLEVKYIAQFNSTDPDIGYNIHKGGAGGNSLNDKEKWSELHKGARNGRYGVATSQETKDKISRANKGRKYSDQVNKTKGRPGVAKPAGFREKISKAQKGRVKSEQELAHLRSALKQTAVKNTGKLIYNNGVREIRLLPSTSPPEGFVRGRLPRISAQMKELCLSTNRLKGFHWYTNGKEEIYSKTCPDGFTSGRLRK